MTSSIDFSQALQTAIEAAHSGAATLMAYFHRRDDLVVEYKSRNDFVSQADKDAEQAIIDKLATLTPQFAIVAEEGHSVTKPDAIATWYIDPLDGTTNFLHGIPHFAVSIGLIAHQGTVLMPGMSPLSEDTPIVSVVYDPCREELFTALYQGGCQLNGHRIRCSNTQSLDDALLATGFPFRDFSFEEEFQPTVQAAIHRTRGVRRYGAAALDLAWVACGRVDGYWEFRLAPWDVAAGVLLVREAGGIAKDLYQQLSWPKTGNVVASNRQIFEDFYAMLAPSLKKPD
ncbi:inositol monophosphatase family protein [Pelistega europaea]|uniref:Inositol-1-monophosphatase n=1 Tax=Pelistega europaea TaxID=106147 RepID=A0A7Y4LBE4_9BURK|nr:inositol monophosphatase family protein [Pelistega europaea]NOL49226.1 inositol monophosphatase [Pelistega europaea]